MTAKLETFVPAAPPAPLSAPAAPAAPAPTEASSREAQERLVRWKAIEEAGGPKAWVEAELKAQGLAPEHEDPSSLTDKEKGAWKEKKKAEAAERRALERLAWEAWRATHIHHLGEGVHWKESTGSDAFDVKDREERARNNGLPEFNSAQALAQALGLSVSRLRWLAYHREVDTGTHYRSWTIPKRGGGLRTITSPKKQLKQAQRWMLSHVVERLPVHGAAHGFVAGRSIVTNALVHQGADVVVKLDVKDFFPSVTWPRVKGLLRKGGLAEHTATLLALLATEAPRDVVQFRGKTLYVARGPRALPQGAPTSPGLTNALCLRLDKRLSALARRLGFTYTRYADDLTFSGRKGRGRTHAPVAVLLARAGHVLEAEGFRVHPDKTRVMRPGSRQVVTGLVVNETSQGRPGARVPREVVRQLRAALHNREQGKPGKPDETLEQLRGLAAFVHMTDPVRGRAFLERLAALDARTSS